MFGMSEKTQKFIDQLHKLQTASPVGAENPPITENLHNRAAACGNCKNCGAPLKSSKCEYCGTEYRTFGGLEGWKGTVTINGEPVEVYVSKVTSQEISNCFRYGSGELHRTSRTIRTFTLIEI